MTPRADDETRVRLAAARVSRAWDDISRVRLELLQHGAAVRAHRTATYRAGRTNAVDAMASGGSSGGLVGGLLDGLDVLDATSVPGAIVMLLVATVAVMSTAPRRARRWRRAEARWPDPGSRDRLEDREMTAIGTWVRARDAYEDATGATPPGEW